MTSDLPTRCKCSGVRGIARSVSPRTVNHAVCYCRDCRAFLHWLERDELLDDHGGTEIIQLGRSRLEIEEGHDQIQCMRLSPKGLHRWYAQCCKTPLANTLPAIPFAGVARAVFDVRADDGESTFGPVMSGHVRQAIGGAPPDAKLRLRDAVHITRLLASWALRGLGHPTPFFDRKNRPVVTPRVLTTAERQQLREHPRA